MNKYVIEIRCDNYLVAKSGIYAVNQEWAERLAGLMFNGPGILLMIKESK